MSIEPSALPIINLTIRTFDPTFLLSAYVLLI